MSEERRGTVLGMSAYLIWGLFPLYWPELEPAGAVEILAHRIVWSLIVAVALIAITRAWRTMPRTVRELQLLSGSSILIGLNWGFYIWATNHGHVVEASLGYFVNPLVTVALGVLVLGERLRTAQWVAVAIAAGGVVVLTVQAGRPPWIALILAFSFGGYGLIKKVVGVEPAAGLAVESALLTPVALAYLVVTGVHGHSTFVTHGAGHALLLASSGPVTIVPLLLFAAAAPKVALSRLGVMQYLTPILQFIIGVAVRHEPLGPARFAGFALVWVALAIFTYDGTRNASRRRDENGPTTATPLLAPEPAARCQ